MNDHSVSCDNLRKFHEMLHEQEEKCRHILVIRGPLSKEFIEAFRDFERRKRELRGWIEAYLFFLRDVFLKDKHDERIYKIIDNDRFDGRKKRALAYIFGCREDQVSETEGDIFSGKDIELYIGEFEYDAFSMYGRELKFPETMQGGIYFKNIRKITERFVFPERMGGRIYFPELTAFSEKTFFPEYVGHSVNLMKLTSLPEGFVFPKYVGGGLYLDRLTSLPAEVTFPEYIGKFVSLNEKLKGHPSVAAVPESVKIYWKK